jgi:hypothetical protein
MDSAPAHVCQVIASEAPALRLYSVDLASPVVRGL